MPRRAGDNDERSVHPRAAASCARSIGPMNSAPSRVGVVFGGPSPEHDVSVLTGLQAVRALTAGRRVAQCHPIFWAKNGAFFAVAADAEAKDFLQGVPFGAQPLGLDLGPEGGFKLRKGGLRPKSEPLELEALLVCCHGGPGEDGSLQGALDLAGIAYSGPTVASAAAGMDKLAQYALVSAAGLPALSRRLLHESTKELDGPGPYIVKPRFGGSSIGIEVVADFQSARDRLAASVHLRRGAVIEPYRPDLYDLQVAVRSWPEVSLSAIERPIRASNSVEFLSYTDKYVGGVGMSAAPRELPAVLPAALAEQLRTVATEAAVVLGVRGVARIDFLSDGEALYLNEINTVPGSLSRHLFVDPPLAFEELLEGLLVEAVERPAARFSSAGADGSVLRDAGAIAAKLA
ncbi:MAG: D-alanine--D-alanine ligase [Acidimicrobiaceae bacterium]|nr:D-alanine--D-alanine ligase [Acidimicrobiaceae bacterium]